MAATTSLLGLVTPTQGTLSGTWGDTVNYGISDYVDISVAGTLTLTNDGAVTLANTTGSSSGNSITSSLTGAGTVTAQFAIVKVTGTLTTAKVVTGPSYSKTYTVVNSATGSTVTFKASGQTGVSIAVGESAFVYFNGTDYVKVSGTVAVASFQTSLGGLTPSTATTGVVTLAGTLNTTSGGTGLTSFTAGDVPYYASGSVLSKLAIGTAGQFLTSTGTAPQWSTLSGVAVTTFSAGTTGFTPSSATSGAVTLAGTLGTANGGTNLTSFTSGGVVYASSSSALATGSALTFDGSRFTVSASGQTSPVSFGQVSSDPTYGLLSFNGAYSATTLTGIWGGAGSPDMIINVPTGGVIVTRVANSTVTTLTSSSLYTASGINVGFGTSNPNLLTWNRAVTTNTASGNVAYELAIGGAAQAYFAADASNIYLAGYANKPLLIRTNNTTALTIDTAQNAGLGVTPSAWNTAIFRTLQVGSGAGSASLIGRTDGVQNAALGSNFYYGSGSFRYIADGTATWYNQQSGVHAWFSAGSGTAGNAISFTQAMTLDASGVAYIGATSGIGSRLNLVKDTNSTVENLLWLRNSGTGYKGSRITFGEYTTVNGYITNQYISSGPTWCTDIGSTDVIRFFTGSDPGTERARIDSSGNVGIGTSSPATKLAVASANEAFRITGSNAYGTVTDGTVTTYLGAVTGGDVGGFTGTLSNHYYAIRTNNTERMRIDSSGNVGIGTSSPVGKLDVQQSTTDMVGLSILNTNNSVGTATSSQVRLGITNSAGVSYAVIKTVEESADDYPALTFGVQNAVTTTPTERLRITSTGNVGIGTSSPIDNGAGYKTLTINSTTSGVLEIQNNGTSRGQIFSDASNFIFNAKSASTGYKFNLAGTTSMVLDSSGNLGLGVTPSAWTTFGSIFQGIGYALAGFSSGSNVQSALFCNSFFSGSNYIYRTSAAASEYLQISGQHQWFTAPSGTAGNPISFTQAMTLDASGNLGLAETSPSAYGGFVTKYAGIGLHANSTSGASGLNLYEGGTGRFSLRTLNGSAGLSFYDSFNGTERARISSDGTFRVKGAGTAGSTDAFQVSGSAPASAASLDSSGNLLVGTTSNSYGASNIILCSNSIVSGLATSTGYSNINSAQLEGTSGRVIANHINGTTTGSIYVGFAYNAGGIGSITQSGTTAVLYNTTSDQRLKENIVDADSASSLIDSLQVRQFDWKTDQTHQRYGFVAQELVTVAPEAVHQPANPEEMMAVDYSKLVPMLVKEIQSLRQRLSAANL